MSLLLLLLSVAFYNFPVQAGLYTVNDNDVEYEWEILSKEDPATYISTLRALKKQRDLTKNSWPFILKDKGFICSLPTSSKTLESEEVLEEEDLVSVDNVLEPLKKNCLYRREAWWSYEFCYGKHIRQFHQEGDKITAEYFLGLASALNPPVEHEKYYSETYTEGTVCDLNGARRASTVNYHCNPTASSDQILQIKEPASCRYSIEIETKHLCDHPKYFVPLFEAEKIYCFEEPMPPEEELEKLFAQPPNKLSVDKGATKVEKKEIDSLDFENIKKLFKSKGIDVPDTQFVFTVIDQDGNQITKDFSDLLNQNKEEENEADELGLEKEEL